MSTHTTTAVTICQCLEMSVLPDAVIVPPRIAVYWLVAYPPCTVLSMVEVAEQMIGAMVQFSIEYMHNNVQAQTTYTT